MTKKLILLDQDGVLADFEQGVRQLWQQTYQQPLPLAERKHFYLRDDMPAQFHQQLAQIYSSKGFFASIPPMADGIAAAKRLLQAGHDVRILSLIHISEPTRPISIAYRKNSTGYVSIWARTGCNASFWPKTKLGCVAIF